MALASFFGFEEKKELPKEIKESPEKLSKKLGMPIATITTEEKFAFIKAGYPSPASEFFKQYRRNKKKKVKNGN